MSERKKTDAIELYRLMLKIRLAERKVAELYPSDKIQSPIHLSIGQEAVAAGVCLALRKEDRVYGTYRGHGIYIATGGNLRGMFAELYGRETGCARGKGGSMHMVSPGTGLMGCSAIVSSMIPVATGHALAVKMQGRKSVVATFFGDGGIDEGVFFESVNFAVLKNLPILYILENNGYAIHSKVADRHKQNELYRIGEGLGLSGRRFEGGDAEAVYEASASAAEEVRRGGPPLLLEFITSRWCEHVGPKTDYEEPYREPGEEFRDLASDPLKKSETALLTRGWADAAAIARWRAEAEEEIEDAVRFAESSPFPEPASLREDQFA